MVDDGWKNFDWDIFAVTAASPLPTVLLALPVVRRFYWTAAGSQK